MRVTYSRFLPGLLFLVALFSLGGVAHAASGGSCADWNAPNQGAGYTPANYSVEYANVIPMFITSQEGAGKPYFDRCSDACVSETNTLDQKGECQTGTIRLSGTSYCYCNFYANGSLYNTHTTHQGNLEYYATVACTISGCSASEGKSCTSGKNSCGMTASGTTLCNGSCSASPPSNASCPVTSCSNGANNPPACNTCTAPLVWNQSSHSCGTAQTPSQGGSGGSGTPPAPACTTNVSKTDIDVGDSDTLTWSCSNASSCTAIDGFSTGGKTSGSASVTPTTTGSVTYGMTCSGSPFYFPAITVHSPNVSISASPNPVTAAGDDTYVSWTSINAASCAITEAVNGANGVTTWSSHSHDLNASLVPAPINAQTTFTINCKTTGGASIPPASVLVDVALLPSDLHEF